jgi:DNA-binding MarR family transcriptional regulator
MERNIATLDVTLVIDGLAAMRTLREWEDAYLPIYGSLLGRDLIFVLAQFELEQRRFTLKELYCSLPYSENAIRMHLKRLLRDGWIALGCSGADRRVRCVVPTGKLERALLEYMAIWHESRRSSPPWRCL